MRASLDGSQAPCALVIGCRGDQFQKVARGAGVACDAIASVAKSIEGAVLAGSWVQPKAWLAACTGSRACAFCACLWASCACGVGGGCQVVADFAGKTFCSITGHTISTAPFALFVTSIQVKPSLTVHTKLATRASQTICNVFSTQFAHCPVQVVPLVANHASRLSRALKAVPWACDTWAVGMQVVLLKTLSTCC